MLFKISKAIFSDIIWRVRMKKKAVGIRALLWMQVYRESRHYG